MAAAVCVLYAATLLAILVSLRHTHGRLIYGLDDPYIHMSIARNFASSGIWGINRGEFAGASSSPLWTLLLAGAFRLFGPVEWVPLALNFVAAGVALLACSRLLRRFMPHLHSAAVALAVLLIAGAPLMMVDGMEHCFQIAFTFCFLSAGLDVLWPANRSSVRPLLIMAAWAALFVGTRFEGLFLVAAVCFVLLLNGKWIAAMAGAAGGWLPVLIYAIFSIRHGGSWLPNSVLIKGNMPPHSIGALIVFAAHGVRAVLIAAPLSATIVACTFLIFLINRDNHPQRRAAQSLILIFLVTAFLHGQFATTGWFSRYEAYLIAAGAAVGCAAFVLFMTATRTQPTWLASHIALIALAGLALAPIGRGLVCFRRTFLAPQNIYEQQVQMAALARRHGGAIAVNDIGAVSWFGKVDVIDLWGLSNNEVYRARRAGRYGPATMAQICDNSGVSLAIVYDNWFAGTGGLPENWRRLGTWTIPHNVAAGSATVSIYAANAKDADEVARAVGEFSRFQLPSEVRVELEAGPGSKARTAEPYPKDSRIDRKNLVKIGDFEQLQQLGTDAK